MFNHVSDYHYLKKNPVPHSQFLFLNSCVLITAYAWLGNEVIYNNSLLLSLLTYDSSDMRVKLNCFFLSFIQLHDFLFHVFRFYFFHYLSLLIVCPLLLHSYPFLTWPLFSWPSVLSLIPFDPHLLSLVPFDPHLLSPICVLTLFSLTIFLLTMFYQHRETHFLNVSGIYF